MPQAACGGARVSPMKVQLNTDSNIDADERLHEHVQSVVEDSLDRFRDQVTRVEVHLADENADKGGDRDKRCMMEARLQGRRPTAVTHHAGSVREAIDGAADKLLRALESELGRIGRR